MLRISQFKQRSSTFNKLNTTSVGADKEVIDEHMILSLNRSSSRLSTKSRRLLKMSRHLKNLSSDTSILKSLCRDIKMVAISDYNNLDVATAHDYSLSSLGSPNQLRYDRLCKSFSFLTSQSRQKRVAALPNILQQQEKLKIYQNLYFSEPTQLNCTLQELNNPKSKQDACVQTSSINFSTDHESTSVNNETNTMMQTNTFGSIVANLGSASIRPSSMIAPSEGLFEINRALVRHRAFSDGQGLSKVPIHVPPQPIHHSLSSSKLLYKRF